MEYGDLFRDMFQDIHETNTVLKYIHPGMSYVTTITLCGQLTHPVDQAEMKVPENLKEMESFGFFRKFSKQNKEFSNCISFKSDTACVKLFANGGVHLTGAKSLVQYVDTMDTLCDCLEHIFGVRYQLVSSKMSMLNCAFHAKCKIPLRRLRDALATMGYMAHYDPDTHSGVRCNTKGSKQHADEDWSILVFSSGNTVMIAKRPHVISRCYDVICRAMDSLFSEDNLPKRQEDMKVSSVNISTYTLRNGYSSRLRHLSLD